MFAGKGISLNDLEKKSFYSFLALYLGSSFLFIILSSYWYYVSQKNSLESMTYYKLEHLADKLSADIIQAHMRSTVLQLPEDKECEYSLVSLDEAKGMKEGYFEENGYKVVVSSSPQEHLNIKYVVVKTDMYEKKLHALQQQVVFIGLVSFLFIGLIAFFLAKLFMKPVHLRIKQIESFLQDVSHELNTPITALKMSASRAIKKEVYDKKILTNISISTKQLETIYNSLTYLNFSDKKEPASEVDLQDIVVRVVKYYEELSSAKGIEVITQLEQKKITIVESRAELLLSNLLSNAIKYSMPETKISIILKPDFLLIKDEGVGIAQDKLDEIFKLYSRESNIAGGFGVGLSIVKQICDEYKIMLEVKSELGKGSEFKLTFKV